MFSLPTLIFSFIAFLTAFSHVSARSPHGRDSHYHRAHRPLRRTVTRSGCKVRSSSVAVSSGTSSSSAHITPVGAAYVEASSSKTTRTTTSTTTTPKTTQTTQTPTTTTHTTTTAVKATTQSTTAKSTTTASSSSSSNSYYSGENTGEATYYNTGLGACGITDSDSTSYIAAMSTEIFDNYPGYDGTNPNNNPLCNKKVKATYNGKTVTVAITDRCAGCATTDLDFSPLAFLELAEYSVGRLTGMTWEWV